jgi:hypothetical protein
MYIRMWGYQASTVSAQQYFCNTGFLFVKFITWPCKPEFFQHFWMLRVLICVGNCVYDQMVHYSASIHTCSKNFPC